MAKCVAPARTFISRLLEALRGCGDRLYMKVTPHMRVDIEWFVEFISDWNGVSLIPAAAPNRTIQVDACLTGIEATDGNIAYAAGVAPERRPSRIHHRAGGG